MTRPGAGGRREPAWRGSPAGERQDVVHIRREYLKRMVCLREMADGGTLLLNPAVRFANGELEAWDFSVRYPGAHRYQSLAQMLEIECELDCRDIDEHEATHDLQRPSLTADATVPPISA
jgi:hypothetical protein